MKRGLNPLFSDDASRTRTSPGRSVLAVAVASLLLAAPGLAAGVLPAGTTAGIAAPSGGDETGFLLDLLLDPSVPTSFRREAAERLAAMASEESVDALEVVARSDDPALGSLVLDGVRANRPVSPGVLELVSTLVAEGVFEADATASALGGIGPGEVGIVVDRLEASREPAARLRLVSLLGGLGDPIVPATLVERIQSDGLPEAERLAIDAALRRWSNMSGRMTPDDWSRWWKGLSVDPDSSQGIRRLANRIASESARAAAAEARAAEAEARADGLSRQIVQLHGRLIALLPEAERIARVQAMLRDDEAMVRFAAVSQIERMLGDGRVLPPEVRVDLLSRLTDEDPTIRIKSAEVLDAMGGGDFGAVLVRSLESERDPAVIRAGLQVLGSRPRPEAVPFAVQRLRDPDGEIERLAARVIASVAIEGGLDPEVRDLVRRRFVEDRGSIDSGDEARLAVLLADEPSLEVELLDAEEEAVRRGAAEAFRTLGLRDLLLEHADDETVARVAVQAWGRIDESIGARNIEVLLELRPASLGVDRETDLATWRAAMERLLEALPVDRVREAEERLADESDLMDARCAMLRRAVAAEAGLEETERRVLHEMLGRNLMAAGRPLEAAAEYRAAGAGEATSPLRPKLLASLLLAEEWEEAASVDPSPKAWIGFLEARRDQDPEFTTRLLDEIDRRFDVDLDEELVSRVGALRGRVSSTAAVGS